jgi:EmrB/QacA subfamily drug resistance transporter
MSAVAAPLPTPVVLERKGHPLRWWILFTILAVEVMDLLDGTIVNVASPAIRLGLHASLGSLQWIAGGYALAFAVGLVVGGRLGDIYGRRRMFLLGVAGFTLASAFCGLAQDPVMLIVSRLVQGTFAAAMIPQGFGIVRESFSDEDLPMAFGLFGPVIGGSAVLGPIIGGLLVDGNLLGQGWRMIFLVNVPLGLIALVLGARVLPESRAAQRPTLDVVGALLAAVAAGLLVFPLIQGREDGWPAWTYAMLAAGGLVLGLFVAYERGRERSGRSPLVTMSLFRKRAFSAGLATALVFFGGMIGVMFTFSLYLQLGNGYSAIEAGVALIPWALGTAIGAGVGSGVLVPRYGRAVLHGGLVLMGLGVLGMIAVVHGGGSDVSAWTLALPELAAGIGMGTMLAPLFSFVLAGVDDHEVGSASGVLNAMQQLGGAAGIALIGTLLFSVAATSGLTTAFERCLWVELGALVVCGLFVLILPRQARPENH